MLIDSVRPYYLEQNYNCAESVIRGANDYYYLGLNDRDMIMAGGFGAGIQTGSTCGAFLSAVSVLSMMYVEKKAHESTDIGPVTKLLTEKFLKKTGSPECSVIKPVFFRPGTRCLATVEAACAALEETIAEYGRK